MQRISRSSWVPLVTAVLAMLGMVVAIAGAHFTATARLDQLSSDVADWKQEMVQFHRVQTKMAFLQIRIAEKVGVDVSQDYFTSNSGPDVFIGTRSLFTSVITDNGLTVSKSR